MDVLVLGDLNLDLRLALDALPPAGGDGIARCLSCHAGGSAANTALVLARLGARVALAGAVGKDPWAELVLAPLARAGVDLRLVRRVPARPSGLMIALVTPNGERTLLGHRGANVAFRPGPALKRAAAAACRLHLSGYALLEPPQREAALLALETALEHGRPVGLDVGLAAPAPEVVERFRQLLPHLDLVLAGEGAARALAGGAASLEGALHTLQGAGPALVAVTRGARGSVLATRARRVALPALPVRAVDTTGAGDAFAAGLVFGRLRGWPLEGSGALAAALGALATTREGAGEALPDGQAVRDLLERLLSDPPAGLPRAGLAAARAGLTRARSRPSRPARRSRPR